MNRFNGRKVDQLQFDLEYRTQFTFIVNDETLSCVLKDIANNSVNIVGILLTKSGENNNFVRLVPGTTESQNIHDLKVVREVLESFNVKFKEETIFALLNIPPGIPGVFSKIYGSLWCKVGVKSFFIGEKDSLFLTVSNIKNATDILKNDYLIQCDNHCE
ncbi:MULTISPECIES: hypothetical protein [Bacillaceae]|uniref:YbaK/aminoacyl-tRNA synthetase-associated domain-containing protein n=1 Tax=Gottfriedia luciferensis TaxID=178774 RepID=A0ABX2ZNT3_9BACI|nr:MULTISPECIES: hypothetical protein [Bacillaceae]ODG90979.1 hypothetical protein BED47_08035 [Gottfriedia luciferensis]PGZ94418.1 hypothetical protein COE53_03045 [Bacillus sp. AFS029533]